MARILITGSSDGIGVVAAQKLIQQGHSVILHARNESRAADANTACPGAEDCLIADLSSLAETQKLAAEVNQKYGALDAVVHNAGIGFRTDPQRTSGISNTFLVNSLAPFVLTSLMEKPKRLVYVSSALNTSGDDSLKDVGWQERKKIEPFQAYSDSKLHNAMFSAAVARLWPDVLAVSLCPGWVPTKLGSHNAPGDLDKSGDVIAWLATEGGQSGKHYEANRSERRPHRAATDISKQDELLTIYEKISGIKLPQ